MPSLKLCPIEDEEDEDIEALKILLDERKQLFRYLFQTYINTVPTHNNGSFEALHPKTDSITVSELFTMFKQHSVTLQMLSYTEVTIIYTFLVNHSG